MTTNQLKEEINKIIGDNLQVFEDSKKVKVKYIKAVDQLLKLYESEKEKHKHQWQQVQTKYMDSIVMVCVECNSTRHIPM